MATLNEVLQTQKRHGVLRSPTKKSSVRKTRAATATATEPTLNITLQNNTSSSNVWAYITGLDINKDNAVFILQSDGVTPYYPASPTSTLTPLQADCNIKLGAPGTTRTVTIPQLAGGRIWFCRDGQLVFLVNPGPALVEPSATNPTDPNYALFWSFAEFTYNAAQLFANITYVDFVSLPTSLALTSNNPGSPPQQVLGIPPAGLDTVCSELAAQHAADGAGWDQLIVKTPSGTQNLRALSPNAGIQLRSSANLFQGYYQPYVAAVWSKYASAPLTLDTQAQWGVLQGRVTADGKLTFPGVGGFAQPSAADVFSCDTGPFGDYDADAAASAAAMGNITARLAAAFNRSTLLSNSVQPDDETVSSYYQAAVTNHYSRIVHGVNLDARGYAFPYDDVAPSDAENVAGTVSDGNPDVFVVAVGGPARVPGVGLGNMRVVGGEKTGLLPEEAESGGTSDPEKAGEGFVIVPRLVRQSSSVVSAATVEAVQRRVEELAGRADRGGPVAARVVKPVVLAVGRAIAALLSLSAGSLVSRVAAVLFVFLLAVVLLLFGHPGAEGMP